MKLFNRTPQNNIDEQNQISEIKNNSPDKNLSKNDKQSGKISANATKNKKSPDKSSDKQPEKTLKTKNPYRQYKLRDLFSKETLSKFKFKMPLGVTIAVCALPAVLTILFYILRPSESAMHWVTVYVSAPIRGLLAAITSVYPFSVTEILIAAAIIWFFYYLTKTISIVKSKRNKLKVLSKRLLLVVTLALYVWTGFCWLWISGYHAPGFADRYNFKREGVAIEDLITITQHFADRANELAPQIQRHSNGSFAESRSALYAASTGIFQNIAEEFPSLDGRLFRPKPMLFSWLMSRTGYSGMYFGLTGEANINNMIHGAYLPGVLAHEHAHHLGIFSEDEANFVAILACIKSDNIVFQYSGYLHGLGHFLRALVEAETYAGSHSPEAAAEIRVAREEILESLVFEVQLDRWENAEFWRSQRTVDTGIGFVDTALTAVNTVLRDTVDSVYDSFLRAQRQELGLRSYGACVDLLIEYFLTRQIIS